MHDQDADIGPVEEPGTRRAVVALLVAAAGTTLLVTGVALAWLLWGDGV